MYVPVFQKQFPELLEGNSFGLDQDQLHPQPPLQEVVPTLLVPNVKRHGDATFM